MFVFKQRKANLCRINALLFFKKNRVQAEEVYVTALVKITKHNANGAENTTPTTSTIEQNYFGDYSTSYSQTTSRYESSMEKTIELRNTFISCLKSQIEILLKVKVSVVLYIDI